MNLQAPPAIDAEAVTEARLGLPEPRILQLVVEAFGALSDRTRAKILYALVRRPLCVRDLALVVDASESAVSHQLRLLRDRRLVRAVRRPGNQIEYRDQDPRVHRMFIDELARNGIAARMDQFDPAT